MLSLLPEAQNRITMSDRQVDILDLLSEEEILIFRSSLLDWGNTNIRSYPWRYSDNPYEVIVSEFMLHRTQTKQVVPIYEHFIERYPSLADYARADHLDAEKILKPLGLGWRIQGMMNALDYLWKEYGRVPIEYDQLVSVPTIGQYIAGAVICFTINRPLTLIDSNIVRVVGRVFDLDISGEARRKKSVIQAITAVVDPIQPRNFYYAIIDLAHSLCRPKNPVCMDCPLSGTTCMFGKRLISHSDQ
jgi:A/G-specific adenine glycosylase